MLLAIGVGMTSASFVHCEADLNKAASTYVVRCLACRDILAGRDIMFQRLERLRDAVAGSEGRLVIAATELGSINLSIAALWRCGIRVITPFWELARYYEELAHLFQVVLIDMRKHSTPSKLSQVIRYHQRRGIVPVLVVEAPCRSSRQYAFLNCRINCSRFLCWLSRETESRMMLIWNKQVGRGQVEVGFDWVTPEMADTQLLLDRIEKEVRREPPQYSWENSAVLFSDKSALRRSFDKMELILGWRQRWLDESSSAVWEQHPAS